MVNEHFGRSAGVAQQDRRTDGVRYALDAKKPRKRRLPYPAELDRRAGKPGIIASLAKPQFDNEAITQD